MEIDGSVEAPFARVRDTVGEVLAEQPGTGASFAVWRGGQWIVDLWAQHTVAFLTGHVHERDDRRENVVPRSSARPWRDSP